MSERTSDRAEREQDKALEDTFPASDPPANSGITGPGRSSSRQNRRPKEEQPTGTPTSDRHATETSWSHESDPQETDKR